MHHISPDGSEALCGKHVGNLFGEDEDSYDVIERTAIGPVIPPIWRTRKVPPGFCPECFGRVAGYEQKELSHSVESALGPRPTHFETGGTAMQKSADDAWKKGWG
jgi:hypothetical protein